MVAIPNYITSQRFKKRYVSKYTAKNSKGKDRVSDEKLPAVYEQ